MIVFELLARAVRWFASLFQREPPAPAPRPPPVLEPIPSAAEVEQRKQEAAELARDTAGDPGKWASDRYRRKP